MVLGGDLGELFGRGARKRVLLAREPLVSEPVAGCPVPPASDGGGYRSAMATKCRIPSGSARSR